MKLLGEPLHFPMHLQQQTVYGNAIEKSFPFRDLGHDQGCSPIIFEKFQKLLLADWRPLQRFRIVGNDYV